MIDLLLLGTGGMLPLPDRWLSSLLVRCRGELTLFDCGEGTQIPWRRFGWGFRRVGAICLSHWHADHIAGLPGVLLSIANAGRTEPVDLYGPRHTETFVNALRVLAPVLPYELRVHELSGGEQFPLPGGLTGRALEAAHRVPCLAYRASVGRSRRFLPEKAEALGVPVHLWRDLQQGRGVRWPGGTAVPDAVLGPARSGLAIAYVTDTRPTPAMPTFLAGVDLLVCEGTYADSADEPKAVAHKHMTFAEAATLARDAGAGTLWLTHFSQSVADPAAYLPEATTIFPNTIAGYSGLTASLRFRDEDEA